MNTAFAFLKAVVVGSFRLNGDCRRTKIYHSFVFFHRIQLCGAFNNIHHTALYVYGNGAQFIYGSDLT